MLNRNHNLGMSRNPIPGIALLDMPQPNCAPAPYVLGTLGASFEVPIEVESSLTRSDERLIKDLVKMLDRQLLAALDSRSAEEFAKVRTEVWPKYVRALRALADTMRNMASEAAIERVSKATFTQISEDLEKQRGTRFGDVLTQQAIFTVWTLERIRSLGFRLAIQPPTLKQRSADLQLNREYRLCSLWSQFHMDILVAAIEYDRTVPSDVQDMICDGLRSAVNAYAIMEEALLLRHPRAEEPPAEALPWDEEDEQLLAASMRDMNADLSDDSV